MLTPEQHDHAQRHGWVVALCIDSGTNAVSYKLQPHPSRERWHYSHLFAEVAQRARGGDAAAVASLKLLTTPPTKQRKRS